MNEQNQSLFLPVQEWGHHVEELLSHSESTDFSRANGLNEVGFKLLWIAKMRQEQPQLSVRSEVNAGGGTHFADLIAIDRATATMHVMEFKYIPLEFIQLPSEVFRSTLGARTSGSDEEMRIRLRDRAEYVRKSLGHVDRARIRVHYFADQQPGWYEVHEVADSAVAQAAYMARQLALQYNVNHVHVYAVIGYGPFVWTKFASLAYHPIG